MALPPYNSRRRCRKFVYMSLAAGLKGVALQQESTGLQNLDVNRRLCNKYIVMKFKGFGEAELIPLLYGGRTSLAIYLATYGVS